LPLTPQQERFCQEYLQDLNATAAYGRAYPDAGPESARRNGSRLLTNADVLGRVAALQAERAERGKVDADRVLIELARLAFFDARTLYRPDGTLKPPAEWDDATAAAVAGVEVDESHVTADGQRSVTARTTKVKRADKVKALELLCRHLGILNDKLTVNTPRRSGLDVNRLPDDAKRTLLAALRGAAGQPSGN
jgi:phage terminase small subunit